jgi:hypothetical protein
MRVSVQGFWAPKSGNRNSEYEDAFYPRHKILGKEDREFRFAVADGATETSFSGIWAKQLVLAFCKGLLDGPEFPESILCLRKTWHAHVSRRPVPWYAEEKIRSGAFAAIIGLTLKETPPEKGRGMWKAIALGDSCMFQVSKARVQRRFPIQKSEEFNNSPRLLASKDTNDVAEPLELPKEAGVWQVGDTFYLMSDAIGSAPARELEGLTDGNAFQSWLKTIRETGDLRNDDVTILKVKIAKG